MVDLLTIVAAGAALVFLFAVKVFLDMQRTMSRDVSRLEEKLVQLERTAVSVSTDVTSIKSSMQEKVDKEYLQKRLDGLVDLLKRKRR